jgi:hypothetical protein
MARRREVQGFWQSYADLAMGVMSVIILILIVLMTQQSSQSRQFAEALLEALIASDRIVASQGAVDAWVESVFEEPGCRLEFDPRTGELQMRGERAAAELYDPGATAVGDAAQEALASCARSFLILATCLGSDDESKRRCIQLVGTATATHSVDPVKAFRDGIEALVLQGNTDRVPYRDAGRVVGLDELRPDPAATARVAFVQNAALGSERARQALGHLLHRVHYHEDASGDANANALELLMSRVRIESPSFGPYQATPRGERPAEPGCEPGRASCDAARNLSLRLRWKRESLQQPFARIRAFFCAELQSTSSSMRSNLSPERLWQAVRVCGEPP